MMKRYTELTHDELLNLTDEGVQTLVELEFAVEGVIFVDPPAPLESSKVNIQPTVMAYRVGDLFFDNIDDAETVMAMPQLTTDYDYKTDNKYKWLKPTERVIEKVMLYQKEKISELAGAIKTDKKNKEKNDRQARVYKDFQEKINTIQAQIWGAVNKARNFQRDIDAAKRHYEKYKLLADGDLVIAEKFLRDAYDAYDGADEIINIALDVKEESAVS